MTRVGLVGAELEENMALRYMAAALEHDGHEVAIVPFNSELDRAQAVKDLLSLAPQIVGLSMVFTSRGLEFCDLAQALRDEGYEGHLIAGGHFAALNCERLLRDFPPFDSVALGEGEDIIRALAADPARLSRIPGLCYRQGDESLATNPSTGNPDALDQLPFPKRTTFNKYFDMPVASILSSRGCWRNCAFCSINAWYKSGGGKRFRIRSVENIVAEMKELYHQHGVRIYNFQDDNFFLPDPARALRRFEQLRAGLEREGVEGIAIAVKARPDSITEESIAVLDDLGLFRVFLGVENASQAALHHLNRKCTVDQILNALRILNDFDVHVAYNLLLFEPDTVMDDLLINLRFMERHVENPFNFCRAEAYAGTGLEERLLAEGALLGDYFGFDYRLKDAHSEAFHQIANYAFFDRNFSDFGLHYFNMQVDFYYQLLRRFYPELLTQTLRSAVRNFIKRTNLDTYEFLCHIYDFVASTDPRDQLGIRGFAEEMRVYVEERSEEQTLVGEQIQNRLGEAYERRGRDTAPDRPMPVEIGLPFLGSRLMPYGGLDSLEDYDYASPWTGRQTGLDRAGMGSAGTPYSVFKRRLEQQRAGRR